MITHASRVATVLTAIGLGAAVLAGCSSDTDDSSAATVPTPSEDSSQGAEEETDMNITPEQVAFLDGLIAEPMPQDEATAAIEEAGYVWRLGTIDGEPQAVTMDYRTDRLTLTVDNGLVTDGSWG
jgi:PBP1b-binding outer membrane lipoprotein LpoB